MPRVTLAQGARIIRDGGIVAFPTETIYGLGANALDRKAVLRIFKAKGRPADNPLIVHVADDLMVSQVALTVTPTARRLMDSFWPGPLTLVLPKREEIPDEVTACLQTVAVRMPSHRTALALIRKAGVPIAAPSANRSGRPSATTAAHVLHDLPRVPVIDGGPSAHGLESTVLDLTTRRPRVLRLGAITLEQLRAHLPGITVAKHTVRRPASPGMKYRHYAPEIPLKVCRTRAQMLRYLKTHPGARALDMPDDPEKAKRSLYHALRRPPAGASELVAVLFPEKGIGRTVNDRLRRAAGLTRT